MPNTQRSMKERNSRGFQYVKWKSEASKLTEPITITILWTPQKQIYHEMDPRMDVSIGWLFLTDKLFAIITPVKELSLMYIADSGHLLKNNLHLVRTTLTLFMPTFCLLGTLEILLWYLALLSTEFKIIILFVINTPNGLFF